MEKAINNKFYKHERLCSRTQINLLFEKNNGVTAFPLKLVFMPATAEMPFQAQAMFVVPKRNFKRAHDRNKLKRRIKEAYRLNKADFYGALDQAGKKMVLAFIYTARRPEGFLEIERAVKKLLEQVVKPQKD